jgi:hypothetical protein
LVPIYLGLCRAADLIAEHAGTSALIKGDIGMGILISAVHTLAMTSAGGFLAWLVYRYLGLKFVSRSWFNLDTTWAVSLVLVGGISLALNVATSH